MAEKYELDRWAAVVCNGFTAVNVMSSGNVEELGWDYTEMELDPTGTCGLFDGMLLDWDDDTPAERRDHEAYFPDAFTVGARILADDWDHELGNDEVRSRCFAIIEDADQFTDHDTARDWLCESTMADFSEVEARTFFQNLTLMDSEEIAKLDGRPIIPSAGADECRAAVLAFNERMVPRRRELGLGDTAVVGKTKKSEATSKVVPMKKEQTVHGLGRVDFSGLGYGWGTKYPDSLSVDAIGIDPPSGERYVILNFSPITHAPDVDGRKLFCHETTIGYDLNADSWSGATIGPDFWALDGKEAREFAEKIGLDRLAARACVRLGIEAPGLTGREALPIPKGVNVAPQPSAQAEAAKAAATKMVSGETGGGKLGHGPYVDSESLRDDLTERFGFFYDIDFSGLTFKTSLILSVKSLYFEGDVVDSALDWQADYLPCVCHRGGQGENDRWEYEPTDDYRPFTRPADIPESIFDKLCASQGTTIEKVVNDPVTKFERSFREDIFNSQQNSLVGLTVLATLPLDAFLDASLSMICRGDREKAGTFTVKPGTYEPIMGIYDPINGCGGTAGIELDTDFDIDPRDIKYTMMEPRGGKWESDRIDLYTPQDCFGFSEPFAGRIEYSEKKPKIAAKAKPDPADLGRRASVAAGATVRDGVDGGGIKL